MKIPFVKFGSDEIHNTVLTETIVKGVGEFCEQSYGAKDSQRKIIQVQIVKYFFTLYIVIKTRFHVITFKSTALSTANVPFLYMYCSGCVTLTEETEVLQFNIMFSL